MLTLPPATGAYEDPAPHTQSTEPAAPISPPPFDAEADLRRLHGLRASLTRLTFAYTALLGTLLALAGHSL